jgi:VCBS repeat-containing protein
MRHPTLGWISASPADGRWWEVALAEIEWTFSGSGVAITITVDTVAETLTVRSDEGSFDLNALWLSDGDSSKDGSWTLTKSDNSLNLNGTGILWDDLLKLSSTGLGSEGTDKDTYVTPGEELVFSFDQLVAAGLDEAFTGYSAEDWAALTLGIRATSVNGTDGAKLVAEEGTIIGTNTPPEISGAVTGEAVEDGSAVTLSALANASDPDGDALQVVDVPVDLPAGVTFDEATQSFTLDPSHAAYQSLATGAQTTVTVNYAVSDGTEQVAASMSWTVTGTNDVATISGSAEGAVAEDGDLVASGVLNLIDVDSGEAAFQDPTSLDGAHGSFSFDAETGAWSYALDNDAAQSLGQGDTATDTLLVTSQDGTASQTITVTISGTNDVPEADNSSAEVMEDEAVSGTVTATDIDTGATLTFSLVDPAPDGLTFNPDGSWTFDASGYDSLADLEKMVITAAFVATDEHNASDVGELAITITGVNDAPEAGNDAWFVSTNTSVSLGAWAVLGNDTDVDGPTPTVAFGLYSLFSTDGGDGGYVIFDGTNFSFTTDGNAGSYYFDYSITDDFGALGGGRVYVEVIGTNDTNSPAELDSFDLGTLAVESFGTGFYDASYIDLKAGSDTLLGTSASVEGAEGRDYIVGGDGDDLISGGFAQDTLLGGSGNDRLDGGVGDDRLLGEAGTDTLIGGAGNDTLTGGGNSDTFAFLAPATGGTDRITDFTVTGGDADKIGLLQGGGGWNAASSSPTTAANFTELAAGDYVVLAGIGDISAADTNKVVELSNGVTATDLATATGGTANAYVVAFNSTTGAGELWWDSDWSDTGERVCVATLPTLTATDVANLSYTNFAEWVV